MKFDLTSIPDLFLVELEPRSDDRGWFARTYCRKEFEKIGFKDEFVQANISVNQKKGTFRGFHFQVPPFQETKLVKCVVGRVLDYAIDLREGSPTFLQHFTAELSAENKKMILIPEGFAHGFLSLEDNSVLIYHHSEYFSAEADRGLRYDDPVLKIQLPFPIDSISQKDKSYPLLNSDFRGFKV